MDNIKNIVSKSMVAKLIATNVIVFIFIQIAILGGFLSQSSVNIESLVCDYLAVPTSFNRLASLFYTPFTYMFLHTSFWHIFGNMLWLYFLGKVFLNVFDGRRLLAVYILGGITGAAFFIAAYNIFPVFAPVLEASYALGASAAVSAVVIAVCVYRPNEQLWFFGLLPLSLKWLGIIYVAIDILSIAGTNPGGHISHLGGAAFGAAFALALRNGTDITRWLCSMIDSIVSWFGIGSNSNTAKKPKMKVSYRKNDTYTPYEEATTTTSDQDFNRRKNDEQEKIDRILEKISKSGYNNLSKEEKDFLFKMSRK